MLHAWISFFLGTPQKFFFRLVVPIAITTTVSYLWPEFTNRLVFEGQVAVERLLPFVWCVLQPIAFILIFFLAFRFVWKKL